MIEIKRIDASTKQDINIPNEEFPIRGRILPRLVDGKWDYSVEEFQEVSSMRFPDENYDFEEMSKDCTFLGAYEDGICVGLAIMQNYYFKYMYLYDLKVNSACRGKGVGRKLIEACVELAKERGYRGVYTVGQDNNLNACLFYVGCGFRIGGCDTEVYKGTNQEGKTDILFYKDAE